MDTGKKRKVNMSEVENVSYGVSLLRDRAFRQLVAVQSLTRVVLEANGLPEQIEKLKSWESKLKIIKEDIKIILNFPELEARQKLLQVEMDLEECKQQLSEVRRQQSEVRRQQSEVREKTRKVDEIFLKNEEFSTETLRKVFHSAVPYMKEVAATYDNQMNLVLSGSNKRDGEMGKDPFKMVEPNWSSHRDNGDIIKIPTPGAPDGANGQPLPPDDIQVNCSSSMLTGGKKINHKAKGKGKGKGIKKQRRPWVTGESSNLGEDNSEELIGGYNEETPKNKEFSPETLGKEKEFSFPVPSMQVVAPTFGHESSSTSGDMDIPICGIDKGPHGMPLVNTITSGMLQQGGSEASEAQYNTNTPPLSRSIETLGKEDKTALSEAGGQGIEIDDVIPIDQDNGSSLARKMMRHEYNSWKFQHFNEDNDKVDAAGFPALEQASQATEFFRQNIEVLVFNTTKEMQDWYTPKDSGWDQLKNWKATLNLAKTIGVEVKFADDSLENISLACFAYSMISGVQGTDINDVIPIDQENGSLLARKMMRREYSSWNFQHFNEDNGKVDAAGFPALEQASQATEFFRQNIEVLVSNTIKEMQEWGTPKDSGWDQLKNWKAKLNLAKRIGVEVKFADDNLENISLACFAYSMISGEG